MTTTLPDKGKLPKRATVAEMADALSLSQTTIRKHVRRAGLKKDRRGTWSTEGVLEAIVRHQDDDNNAERGGPLSRARVEKTKLEAEILRVKLGAIRNEYIPMSEHLDSIRELVEVLTGGLERWCQAVAQEFHNAEIFTMAKRIRDETRRALAARFRAGADENEETRNSTEERGGE